MANQFEWRGGPPRPAGPKQQQYLMDAYEGRRDGRVVDGGGWKTTLVLPVTSTPERADFVRVRHFVGPLTRFVGKSATTARSHQYDARRR
jgi:hypothetical protein